MDQLSLLDSLELLLSNPWLSHFLYEQEQGWQNAERLIKEVIPSNTKETNAREQAIGMQQGLQDFRIRALQKYNELWQMKFNPEQSPQTNPEDSV